MECPEAAQLPDLDGLVYRSNLLGRDRAVVNIFGGNTSAKLHMTDHVGREVMVLAVKASGSDVLTITSRSSPCSAWTRSSRFSPVKP